VLGIFYFDLSAYGALASAAGFNLFLYEYIKVDRGGLVYIYAPIKNLPTAKTVPKEAVGLMPTLFAISLYSLWAQVKAKPWPN
jgi:hypothetical protein